jgi:glycosyltransferase involved in cell wall biosynthesis
MNILLITPGINKKYNDNYYAYAHMCTMGNKIIAISQRQNINKAGPSDLSLEIETDGNLKIYRLFNTLKQKKSIIKNIFVFFKIKKFLLRFKPDVIFCEELSGFLLAFLIGKFYGIPIVLRVEYLYNKNYPYRVMGRFLQLFKNRITGDYLSNLVGDVIWKSASKISNATISCYFGDASDLKKLSNHYYVPWPTFCPKIIDNHSRVKERAIFIGSFDLHKNLQELETTIPLIFQLTPLKEFWIIGSGVDINIINNLKNLYPNKIKHIESLNRHECLKLIQGSFFSYSPAKRGGWGFIGDSWAMRTPIIVTNNHYDFVDGVDAIVTNPIDIIHRINELYNDAHLFNKIIDGGYTRYASNYSAESVGEKYYNICKSSIVKH